MVGEILKKGWNMLEALVNPPEEYSPERMEHANAVREGRLESTRLQNVLDMEMPYLQDADDLIMNPTGVFDLADGLASQAKLPKKPPAPGRHKEGLA